MSLKYTNSKTIIDLMAFRIVLKI